MGWFLYGNGASLTCSIDEDGRKSWHGWCAQRSIADPLLGIDGSHKDFTTLALVQQAKCCWSLSQQDDLPEFSASSFARLIEHDPTRLYGAVSFLLRQDAGTPALVSFELVAPPSRFHAFDQLLERVLVSSGLRYELHSFMAGADGEHPRRPRTTARLARVPQERIIDTF